MVSVDEAKMRYSIFHNGNWILPFCVVSYLTGLTLYTGYLTWLIA